MTGYSLAEIGVALVLDSLIMFSDGLHNLSDGVALGVAFWAEKSKLRTGATALTYGWRRTELLGGLFNGLFLVSMAVFVLLQSIPDLIRPRVIENTGSLEFIVVSGVGMFFNVVGTFMFSGHGYVLRVSRKRVGQIGAYGPSWTLIPLLFFLLCFAFSFFFFLSFCPLHSFPSFLGIFFCFGGLFLPPPFPFLCFQP